MSDRDILIDRLRQSGTGQAKLKALREVLPKRGGLSRARVKDAMREAGVKAVGSGTLDKVERFLS